MWSWKKNISIFSCIQYIYNFKNKRGISGMWTRKMNLHYKYWTAVLLYWVHLISNHLSIAETFLIHSVTDMLYSCLALTRVYIPRLWFKRWGAVGTNPQWMARTWSRQDLEHCFDMQYSELSRSQFASIGRERTLTLRHLSESDRNQIIIIMLKHHGH